MNLKNSHDCNEGYSSIDLSIDKIDDYKNKLKLIKKEEDVFKA